MKKFNLIILSFFPTILFAQIAPTMLNVQDAIKIAIENNYDVIITKNQIEIGEINNSWANTGLIPTIGVTANANTANNNLEQQLSNGNNVKTNGVATSNVNAGLGVSWKFFDGFKMFATKNRLEELEKIGELSFTKMVNETAYNVIAAYYNIIRLKQQKVATEEVITLYEERLKVAETRFNIGSSPKTDFLQAQVDLIEQQSILISIENAISLAKTELNNLLARDATTLFETENSFALNKPLDFTTIQQKIDKQNPDILLAQSNLAVLIQTKKEINAQRLPTATFNGNYNFVRNKNTAGFTLLNQTYGPSAGVGITIPLLSGLVVKRQLQIADINIKNQDLYIKQVKQQLQNNLTNAYLNYNNGLKLAALEEKNLALIKENSFISLERFKKLSITSIELRQVQINYVDGQTRLINAQYQAKVAEAEILLLAGDIANL